MFKAKEKTNMSWVILEYPVMSSFSYTEKQGNFNDFDFDWTGYAEGSI